MYPESKSKSSRLSIPELKMPIPTNPVVYATLRALYAGGLDFRWISDSYGRPHYRYESRDGYINIFCDPPYKGYPSWPEEVLKKAASLQKLYMNPRWNFIYAGILRDTIRKLSVETADVYLILLSKIAQLKNPGYDIARISLKEIAKYRAVRVRNGSRQKLINNLKEEVLRLADLRLTMTWQDYKNRGTMTFGRERPDRLLDIVDISYNRNKDEWTSFGFRCGQALAAFLNPGGLRWIGYYSNALLQLDPYHEAFTKKLGTYWILLGITAGKRGQYPRASPQIILNFCGKSANQRNPGKTVDAFIKAHIRLREIGVLEDIPVLEPPTRIKGYFNKWLDTPLSVKLSSDLWRIKERKRKTVLLRGKITIPNKKNDNIQLQTLIPGNYRELQVNPGSIRQFRTEYGLHQTELAQVLGVTRQTLSYYEREIRALPEKTAILILKLWEQKSKS